MKAAIRTGIFCAVLAGFCFLLSGLLGRALSLDPLVPFLMMAGVLGPMVMVASGMLARWALYSPFGERRRGSPALASLASGLITAFFGAMLCTLMLALSKDVFPLAYALSPDIHAVPGLAMVLAAYAAMSLVGGELYGLIFPEAIRSYGRHRLSMPPGDIEGDERRTSEHTRGDT